MPMRASARPLHHLEANIQVVLQLHRLETNILEVLQLRHLDINIPVVARLHHLAVKHLAVIQIKADMEIAKIRHLGTTLRSEPQVEPYPTASTQVHHLDPVLGAQLQA